MLTIRAYGLILPLLLFIIVAFVVPIGVILVKSADNPEVVGHLPHTIAAIDSWDGRGLPEESVYAALAVDLKEGYRKKTIQPAAVRLNYEITGFRTLLLRTARKLQKLDSGPYKPILRSIDKRWGEREYWAAIKRNAWFLTTHYYLSAVDLERDADNNLTRVPERRAIYLIVYARTFGISLLVSLFCLIIGYPMAYLLATVPSRVSNLLMILVLLPFWTSSLVRSIAWVVLLQRKGLINDGLIALGFLSEPLALIFNRPGLLIAMTHVMLPFMVLPLYSVMKGIDPHHMRAATSLGAHPVVAFFTVYLPLSLPGIGAGSLLVFIISIGFYITPELVGGGREQMVSQFIAMYANELLNWGQAAALAVILLLAVAAFYALYNRIVGIERF